MSYILLLKLPGLVVFFSSQLQEFYLPFDLYSFISLTIIFVRNKSAEYYNVIFVDQLCFCFFYLIPQMLN